MSQGQGWQQIRDVFPAQILPSAGLRLSTLLAPLPTSTLRMRASRHMLALCSVQRGIQPELTSVSTKLPPSLCCTPLQPLMYSVASLKMYSSPTGTPRHSPLAARLFGILDLYSAINRCYNAISG